MFSTFLMVMLTQVIPCTPGETSVVCICKAGSVSACAALVEEDAEKAAQLLDKVEDALTALEMAGKANSEKDKEKEQLQKMAEVLAGEQISEPPNCKGQKHHLISRRVARRLEQHPILKGLFKLRDPRFVARAKDEQAHCGYQNWHREVDKELVDWLKRRPKATLEDFLGKLREIYSRPEMKERFPDGF